MATTTVPALPEARYTVSSTFDAQQYRSLMEMKAAERVDTATALREAWEYYYPRWRRRRG